MTELQQIAWDLLTQDNRCTEHPIFLVQEKDIRTEVHNDQDIYDDKYWVDEDWERVGEEASDQLDTLEENFEDTSGFTRVYEYHSWRTVQPFLTEYGAKCYIESNSHNLRNPRIYVASAYRNYEWQFVRDELIPTLAKIEQILDAHQVVIVLKTPTGYEVQLSGEFKTRGSTLQDTLSQLP